MIKRTKRLATGMCGRWKILVPAPAMAAPDVPLGMVKPRLVKMA
jgi:hypothetical protein